jgi:hypothetical protein
VTIVQCSKCFAGNAASASSCHNCGARLKYTGSVGTEIRGDVKIADENVHDSYILDTAMAATRAREARVARRLLALAALLYFLRVALVPVLLAFVKPDKFAPFAGAHVTPVHYVCFFVFAFCALWARREPLTATLTAGVLFLFAAVPGVLENPTITGGALVGKLLMLGIVGRAVSAAIVYRANCSRPDLHAPAKAPPTSHDGVAV